MSTHNIGFYEDLTKNIFELSSNIIKYAPHFPYKNEKVAARLLLLCSNQICMQQLVATK